LSAEEEPVHLWEVLGSTPLLERRENASHPAYSNLKFSVVARNMDRVIVVTRKMYPEIRFHSIQRRNHLGKQSVLIDKDTIEEA
jgi:hypothetical protein